MNPFVWVLVNSYNDRVAYQDDWPTATLEAAWIALAAQLENSVSELQSRKYRVLRCRLVEVGPA